MYSPLHALVGPAMLLAGLQDILTTGFWKHLYYSGQVGEYAGPFKFSLLVLILVRVVVAALILLAARVAAHLVRRMVAHGVSAAVARAGRGQLRLTTLQGLLTSTLNYIIFFFAIILILFTVGLTWAGLAPLLGAASVLGLAVGFGAQRLVRDIITGLFILGEGQFDVGEWVTIGSVTGRVEDMGLRITRLRDDQGRMYVIANGDITQVFNASRGLVRLPIEVALQRSLPLDAALSALQEAADASLREFDVHPSAQDLPQIIVVGMEAAKVTVRLVLWVPVVKKEQMEDDLRRRVLAVTNGDKAEIALA